MDKFMENWQDYNNDSIDSITRGVANSIDGNEKPKIEIENKNNSALYLNLAAAIFILSLGIYSWSKVKQNELLNKTFPELQIKLDSLRSTYDSKKDSFYQSINAAWEEIDSNNIKYINEEKNICNEHKLKLKQLNEK